MSGRLLLTHAATMTDVVKESSRSKFHATESHSSFFSFKWRHLGEVIFRTSEKLDGNFGELMSMLDVTRHLGLPSLRPLLNEH